jgi:hypothetical protein
MLCRIAKIENPDRQEWLQNRRSLDQHNSFCTCPPSGNQVDGLPLAPRWLFPGRACIHKTRRVFSSSGDVSEPNVLVNPENLDSLYIEASSGASECSK